jgi:hypothetical protein
MDYKTIKYMLKSLLLIYKWSSIWLNTNVQNAEWNMINQENA